MEILYQCTQFATEPEKDTSYFKEIENYRNKNNPKYNNFKDISNFKSKMLSSITLGVWVNWFKAQNHQTYVTYLSGCFTKDYRKKYKYSQIINNLDIIYKTRNQIAHHERLLNKGLSIEKRCETIQDAILGMINDKDSEIKKHIKKEIDNCLVWVRYPKFCK